MIDPGNTKRSIISLIVSEFLLVTVVKKTFLSSVLSTPPTTQTPSTRAPRWYFLLPNFDSSISTMIPGPPNIANILVIYIVHTIIKEHTNFDIVISNISLHHILKVYD